MVITEMLTTIWTIGCATVQNPNPNNTYSSGQSRDQSRSSLYAEYASPKHQGAPLLSKMISSNFRIWPAVIKTWMIIDCNAVLSRILHKNLSNRVTWMSYSLLLETKTMSWKHSEPRKRHCFSSAIRDGQMRFIHSFIPPPAHCCCAAFKPKHS